jgi:hypothetical protein
MSMQSSMTATWSGKVFKVMRLFTAEFSQVKQQTQQLLGEADDEDEEDD